MTKRIKNSKHKVGILVAGVILLLFVLINIKWYLFDYLPYYSCISNNSSEAKITKSAYSTRYVMEDEEFAYIVAVPNYLTDSGFLEIEKKIDNERNLENASIIGKGKVDIVLFIWKKTFGQTKYGVMVTEWEKSTFHQFYIDKDLNYIPQEENENNVELTETVKNILDEHYQYIGELMDAAQSYWILE